MVDIDALDRLLGDDVAAFMLTNPNTLGLFEKNIERIAQKVHAAGGLLYYDGANANAILSLMTDLAHEHKLTMVSVLHDCDLAERYADRIIGLDAGTAMYDSAVTPGHRFQPCGACQTM